MYKSLILFEDPKSIWSKRYMRHYAYRDSFTATTALASASYNLGTNARAVNVRNWPQLNDARQSGEIPAGTCYGREIKLLCTLDAYFTLVGLNPRYWNLYTKLLFNERTPSEAAQILATQGILQYITEVEQFLPANDEITLFPIWATSINYRYHTLAGTIYVWIEGNVEGQD